MAALLTFALSVALIVLACIITWRLAARTYDGRLNETWGLLYMMQAEVGEAKDELANLKAEALAYGDALNDIVDLADWADVLPFASETARVTEVVAIAKQALETRAYPGRLRAAQEALEQAEADLQTLHAQNVELAELAVSPQ